MISSDYVLTWAKRIEAQRAQAVVINGLHMAKTFDVMSLKDEFKQRETKPAKPVKMPTIRRCKYCGQVHKQR